MLTESRKQDLKNLINDLIIHFNEYDGEGMSETESDICFDLKHILEWIDEW